HGGQRNGQATPLGSGQESQLDGPSESFNLIFAATARFAQHANPAVGKGGRDHRRVEVATAVFVDDKANGVVIREVVDGRLHQGNDAKRKGGGFGAVKVDELVDTRSRGDHRARQCD